MLYILKDGYKILIKERLLVSASGVHSLSEAEVKILVKHEFSPLKEEDFKNLSSSIHKAFLKVTPSSKTLEARDQWIIKQITLEDPSMVLELGSGTEARLENQIFHHFPDKSYTGIDLLEGASRRNVQGNFLTFYPVQDNHLVILEEVIEHLTPDEVYQLIDLSYRKNAKKIIITTPNHDFTVNVIGRRFRHHDHKFEWNKNEVDLFIKKIEATYDCEVSLSEIGERIMNHAPTWGMVIKFYT